MPLTDMKQSKREAKKNHEVCSDSPRFPYGLDLDLDTESLEKLGITDLPEVGSEMIVVAVGVVTSARTNERAEGKANRNITIQLQKLEVGPLEESTAEDAISKAIKNV